MLFFNKVAYLACGRWISLVLLTVGVSMAQLSANQNKTDNKAIDTSEMNTTFGFVAVMTAAVTSGFAGVYFERILKSSTTTLWMRNVQMGIFSIIIAFITVYFHSSVSISQLYMRCLICVRKVVCADIAVGV